MNETERPGTTLVLHGVEIFIPSGTPPEFIHEASLLLERVYLMESADCGGS
jgi:hypothetical protein